jgi:hypothetical protein
VKGYMVGINFSGLGLYRALLKDGNRFSLWEDILL